MSIARDKLFAEFDRYIAAMKAVGKNPSALYVTKNQWDQLGLGLYFEEAGWKADCPGEHPRYKGFNVMKHG